ncbi:MAG: HAD family hydrolase [Formosimonas sp.]
MTCSIALDMRVEAQLIVFDWDGTLFDSTGVIAHSLQHACAAIHKPVPSLHDAQQVIGLGFAQAIDGLVGRLDAAQTEQFMLAYRRSYYANENLVVLFSGIHELLLRLHAQGRYLAIATGKSRASLDRVLAHNPDLNRLFMASRTADQTQSKPHPQMLHELLDELAVPAECAAMVGDTHFDVDMARQAGVQSIAVAYGAHTQRVLEAAQPTHLVGTVAELAHILGG